MQVRISRKFQDGGALELEDVSAAVIRDDHGNPLVIAYKIDDGAIIYTDASKPEFKEALESLGL